MKILLVLLGLCFLQGCTTAVKTIEVLNRPEPKTPLNLDMPETLSLEPLEWIIITPDNAEEVWAKLGEDPKGEVVLFALNETGYELLAKNYASILAYNFPKSDWYRKSYNLINGLDDINNNEKWYEQFNPIKIFRQIEKKDSNDTQIKYIE